MQKRGRAVDLHSHNAWAHARKSSQSINIYAIYIYTDSVRLSSINVIFSEYVNLMGVS